MSAGPADKDDEATPTEASGEVESWLREAARVPAAVPQVRLPQPGEVVGEKYRIEASLGQGGMGAVFRATHLVSEKLVALKWMLRPSSDEHASRRFMREVRAAGRIAHPNVVDVYDVGQQGDWNYLVMELLRGEALRARLDRGILGVTEAVDLLLPAMRGVAAAHRAEVIHRDLKPDNVFLCESHDGVPSQAKVLDFGISEIGSADVGDPTLTKEGTVLGTPAYMSPEQLQSSRNLDRRTDVYAFGVIMYEALTGKLPFTADSFSGLVIAIANTEPVPPSRLRPELPIGLERVILRALAKDRDQRYPDMESLIEAATPYASQRNSASSGIPAIALAQPTGRPVKTWAALGIAVMLVLVLAAWIAGGPSTPPVPSPTPSTPAPRAAAATPSPQPISPSPSPVAIPASVEAALLPRGVDNSPPAVPSKRALRPEGARTKPSQKPAVPETKKPEEPVVPETKARSGTISLDRL